MHPIILVLIFIVATVVGYLLIKKRSQPSAHAADVRMNALSGITVLGALAATGAAVSLGSKALGFLAIVLAMLNVAGGFGVTHRMLRMFRHKREKEDIRNE